MTITTHDRIAILPKRCDKCHRKFWLEPYNIFGRAVGIGGYSIEYIECKKCEDKIRKPESEEQIMEDNRKTGYWRWDQSYPDNPKIGDWHCSECNWVTSSELISDRLYNYCPNCGAKMEANIDEILNRIIKKDVAKQIWAIAGISPEHGNAVMDIIGEEAYQNIMRLQSESEV